MLVAKLGYLRLRDEQRLGVLEDTVPRLISDQGDRMQWEAVKHCKVRS